jgi:hypothetical protein
VLSKSTLQRLQDNTVWMIVGETLKGAHRKQFSLGSVFRVSEVGDVEEGEFKHFACGSGHVFEPPSLISDKPWFDEFRLRLRSFEGIQPVADEAHLAALKEIADSRGCVVE